MSIFFSEQETLNKKEYIKEIIMKSNSLFFKKVLVCAALTLTFCMTTACGSGTDNNNMTDNGTDTPGTNTTVDDTNNGAGNTNNTTNGTGNDTNNGDGVVNDAVDDVVDGAEDVGDDVVDTVEDIGDDVTDDANGTDANGTNGTTNGAGK